MNQEEYEYRKQRFKKLSSYTGKNHQYFERDKHISLQVLSGRTLESQAQDYGITRERVRQIVNRFLRMVDAPPREGDPLQTGLFASFDIRKLRKQKRFFDAIQSLTR